MPGLVGSAGTTNTSGNDTITATVNAPGGGVASTTTLNALDNIDGGAGTDTLTLNAVTALASADLTGVTIANVETINVRAALTVGTVGLNDTLNDGDASDNDGTASAGFDVSNVTGLTALNVTQATAASVKAAATTNVTVSGVTGGIEVNGGNTVTVTDSTLGNNITVGSIVAAAGDAANSAGTAATGTITVTDTKQGAGVIQVDGGTDVTVTASTDKANSGAIIVGASTAATGNVTVTQNVTHDTTVGGITAGDISVKGGKTVTVNVNTTNTASKDSPAANNITAGSILVTSGTDTSTVSVKQTHVANDYASVTTGASKETAAVTFASLKSGERVAISEGALTALGTDVTFTASKDLTAAEVAAAFASLTAADTQAAGGVVANGFFTGALDAGWTSGSASGSTVTFTGTANGDKTDLVVTTRNAADSGATTNAASFTIAKVDGSGGTSTTARDLATANGNVRVDEAGTASITTVTLDGFGNADLGSTGNDLDALTTLNLTNSTGDTTLRTASKTLAVKLDKIVGGDVDLGGNVETLTLTTAGTASNVDLKAAATKTLTIDAGVGLTLQDGGNYDDALETVTIKGAGAVNLGTISGASTNLKSFSAADNTGGVTATVTAATAGVHADFTKYVFSQGNDAVTLSATGVNKAVELGAGNDTITLASGTTSLAANVDGGTGTNTLAMAAADASTSGATANGTFETKISNFQKLSLGAVAGGADLDVDLANMDDISYVISANTTGASAARATETTVTFGALTAGQSLTLGGLTLTAYGNIASGTVASAFASLANGAAGVSPANGTFTGTFSADWTSGAATGNDVKFTHDATGANAAITTTEAGALAAPAITYLFTDGTDGVSAGTVDMTFGALAIGQSYTVLGVTVTAKTAQLDTAVAAKILAALDAATPSTTSDANFLVSGTVDTAAFTGWTLATFSDRTTVAGAKLTITDSVQAAATNDPTAAAISSKSAVVAAPANLAETAVVGAAAGAVVAGILTLNNMADAGTLELTAAGAGVVVEMANATGGADSFNIITKVSDATTNAVTVGFGTVEVAGVETINVTATDSNVDEDADGTSYEANDRDSATLTVKADTATTVNVTGNSNLSLSLDGASNKVTLVNASDLTGALTMTAGGAAAGIEIRGGSGADVLTASGENDVLKGNAGADTFNLVDLTSAYGGDGADIFNFAINSNLAKVSKIMDLGSGDVINLVDLGTAAKVVKAAGVEVDKFYSAGAQYNADTTVDVAGKVNAALVQTGEGEATWFQHNGNTYIVIDADDSSDIAAGAVDTYQEGQDIVIQIVGTFNLSTGASFNATNGTLEIV